MFGSNILDTAIGLALIYSILSVITSSINEMISSRTGKRATNLAQGITELLNDDKAVTLQKLYDHPFISSLFRGKYDAALKENTLPSYIPSRNFALAIMDLVRKSGSESGSPTDFVACVDKMPDGPIKESLQAIVSNAGNDASKIRETIEQWYNSSMDRVAGWYKRHTQRVILVIGIVTVCVLNADTFSMGRILSQEQGIRSSVVMAASGLATKNGSKPGQTALDEKLSSLEHTGLPFGWHPGDSRLMPQSLGGWINKMFGLLLTAVAVSLGAPFWFDVLNRLMVVRSTVKPHEKSPEEGSVDRPDAAASQD
jgi:hypothetical protein